MDIAPVSPKIWPRAVRNVDLADLPIVKHSGFRVTFVFAEPNMGIFVGIAALVISDLRLRLFRRPRIIGESAADDNRIWRWFAATKQLINRIGAIVPLQPSKYRSPHTT